MVWLKLSDDFYQHPKILAAGPEAESLWLRGLAYSCRYLTDGHIPTCVLPILTQASDPAALAARLVEVRLWHLADDGWTIHDYLDYQPSRQSVERDRTQRAARQSRYSKRGRSQGSDADGDSDGTNDGDSDGTNDGDSDGSPGPGPGPGPGPAKPSDPSGSKPSEPLASRPLEHAAAAPLTRSSKRRGKTPNDDDVLISDIDRDDIRDVVQMYCEARKSEEYWYLKHNDYDAIIKMLDTCTPDDFEQVLETNQAYINFDGIAQICGLVRKFKTPPRPRPKANPDKTLQKIANETRGTTEDDW